jgi:hypothetical protein
MKHKLQGQSFCTLKQMVHIVTTGLICIIKTNNFSDNNYKFLYGE